MRILILLAALLAAVESYAEVCIENDSHEPEEAFTYQFTPSVQIDRSNPSHHRLTSPTAFELKHLAQRKDACIEFKETSVPGSPGYLLIRIKPPASLRVAYKSETLLYVSKEPVSATASSTRMLAVESGENGAIIVKSILDEGPILKFDMEKVYVTSQK